MAEPLIPADVRALYEELLNEGGRIAPSTDPMWQEPTVQALLRAGLAAHDGREPPTLGSAMPDTAFAKLLLHWQLAMDELRKKTDMLQRAAVRTERLHLRSKEQRNPNYACILIENGRHVSAMHVVLCQSAETQACGVATGPLGEAIALPSGEQQKVNDLYIPQSPRCLLVAAATACSWTRTS